MKRRTRTETRLKGRGDAHYRPDPSLSPPKSESPRRDVSTTKTPVKEEDASDAESEHGIKEEPGDDPGTAGGVGETTEKEMRDHLEGFTGPIGKAERRRVHKLDCKISLEPMMIRSWLGAAFAQSRMPSIR